MHLGEKIRSSELTQGERNENGMVLFPLKVYPFTFRLLLELSEAASVKVRNISSSGPSWSKHR